MEFHDRLKRGIRKYEAGEYTEQDFHGTLESIINTITENELYPLREFLKQMEAELELIDFLVNESKKRESYLKIIDEIKNHLKNY
jgi:hypothetical protein